MSQFVGGYYEVTNVKHEKLQSSLTETISGSVSNTKKHFINEEHFFLGYDVEKGTEEKGKYFYDDQFHVYFDGECYNAEKLKWRINEDIHIEGPYMPEIIAKLFRTYYTDVFEFIIGKFSLIIWDKKNKTIYGARDHFGVKPLFYHENDKTFIFSSSKKGIVLFLGKEAIDPEALQHYFSFQYVPEPFTLTKGVHMVHPGTYFIKSEDHPIQFIRYWKATFNPIHTDKNYWVTEIRNVMLEKVKAYMKNENKRIGNFLSGGIDSTLIVSLAKQIKQDIKTFSVGFEQEGFSEVGLAQETATKLEVENISTIITPEQYVDKIPEIIWQLDDPLADPSCVPLYFVAKEASKHVDIVLSGEGADELFGGYNIYREPTSLKIFDYIPKQIRRALRQYAQHLPKHVRGKSFIIRGTTPLNERYIGNAKMFEEEEKQHFLHYFDENVSYKQITGQLFEHVKDEPLVSQMQYIDINTWLCGDILLKAEKLSQANGIEIRMPFMDKEVFELASKIPVELKVTNLTTKYILREASRGIVPDHVLHRKKLGFPVPIRHWLKRELNGWAKQVIAESEVEEYINKSYVNNLLDTHCKGNADYSRKIWTFLIFMVWHQVFIEGKYNFSKQKVEQINNRIYV
ncbi:asparagine synthase (glutamine-hydrolyzing) [Pseudogracilibacillus sp. SO30301A]|uniref:asparagine synthase (glutamine-hydrolyzing) n=1 Tax=Pseudogracilibacillus sp. SO30301A TaxID=3098291 RepID=UPI00300DDEA8